MSPLLGFPPAFLRFLQENDIEKDVLDALGSLKMVSDCDSNHVAASLPHRYLTVNPNRKCIDWARLEKQLGCAPEQVPWLPDFYCVPGHVKLASCDANGDVLGMDIASGLAVKALSIGSGQHVLDLCCAPGAKLQRIAWDLERLDDGAHPGGSVTGVDLSQHRLSTCRSIIKKYKSQRNRLFHADGCQFDVGAPTPLEEIIAQTHSQDDRQRPTFIKPFHASKLLRHDPQLDNLYDSVLVDAECTHDGSIVHLVKYARGHADWKQFEERFLDENRLAELESLQRGLISNGYRLLKPGSVMVYSTCSLSRRQNQDIIQWFLKQHSDARLESVDEKKNFPAINHSTLHHDDPVLANIEQKCLRLTGQFTKDQSGSEWWISGLFIARIRKCQ